MVVPMPEYRVRSIAFGLPGFRRGDSSNDKVTECISTNPTHITHTLCRGCAGAELAEINADLSDGSVELIISG